MRRIGRRHVADWRQWRVLARPAQRIPRRGSSAGLYDSVAVRERLHGFISDGGRIRRALYRRGGHPLEAASDRTGGNEDMVR